MNECSTRGIGIVKAWPYVHEIGNHVALTRRSFLGIDTASVADVVRKFSGAFQLGTARAGGHRTAPPNGDSRSASSASSASSSAGRLPARTCQRPLPAETRIVLDQDNTLGQGDNG